MKSASEDLGVTEDELEALGVEPGSDDPARWAADHGIAAVLARLVARLERGGVAPRWTWPGCELADPGTTSEAAPADDLTPSPSRPVWRETWRMLGPLREDRLALVVGPTKRGKTAWALGMAEAAAASNPDAPVLYVSAELGEDEVAARLLALRAKGEAAWSAILRGRYETAAVDHAGAELCASLPALYVWTPGVLQRNGPELREKVALVSAAHGYQPVLVVLDYLQRFTPAGTTELRLAVRDVSGELRDITRPGRRPALTWWPADQPWPGACAVVLSSAPRLLYETLGTCRGVENASVETLESAGKECGELEYDATILAVLTSDPPDQKRATRNGIFRVVVVRDGNPGDVPMTFDGAAGRWSEREVGGDLRGGNATTRRSSR